MLVRKIFREIALTLAGVFSLYEVDDDAIRAITRGVLDVFESHTDAGLPHQSAQQHPAVTEMLAAIEGEPNPTNDKR
ncbi:MAG: hypothetical protein MJE77_18075 [Proteobacteria bacterium]|nr:hypothetical protein [Pseudomonadota bacterium]